MSKIAIGPQLRAARNGLGWSIQELADFSGISVRTIVRYEDCSGVPATRSGNLDTLIAKLEAAGIEFIGSPDDAPGIRIHNKSNGPNQNS